MKDERPLNQSGDRQGERDSQVSAMFDGELPAAECELLARRLVRDEALRSQWSRYALIGAALRAERGVALHDRVAWRVQSVVSQEASYGDSTTVDAAGTAARSAEVMQSSGVSRTDRWTRFARPVFGAGIAAGVAAMSILWLRTQDNTDAALVAGNRAPSTATITEIVATPTTPTHIVASNSNPAPVRGSVAAPRATVRNDAGTELAHQHRAARAACKLRGRSQ